MNCSWLTASTAGTESTAKITSVASTNNNTANRGVATRFALRLVKSFWPSYSSVDGTILLTALRNFESVGSACSSLPNTSFAAVYSRNAPNT